MITLYIDSVGLVAPGLIGWPAARAILNGSADYVWQDVPPTAPAILAPAERRRCIALARLTLNAAHEAMQGAPSKAHQQLACVFSSSDGDSQTIIQIMDGLTQDEPAVSPTRFANSVHNATAGYWSMATGMKLGSTCLSAFDESFAAGLLEAAAQTADEQVDALYTASDARILEPFSELRPIEIDCATSLLLTWERSAASLARLEIDLVQARPATALPACLPTPFASCPAARALPLLAALAAARESTVDFDYLGKTLSVRVFPC